MKKYLKLVASSKLLVGEVGKLYTPLMKTDISVRELATVIKSNAQHLIGTSEVIKKI